MASTLNFDTPSSSTSRPVAVTGTIAAASFGLLTIDLNVTNASTPARDRSYYKEINFDNSASPTFLAVNTSYTMSIVPKLLGSDTVSLVSAWSYINS
jgi:hypothetical protein